MQTPAPLADTQPPARAAVPADTRLRRDATHARAPVKPALAKRDGAATDGPPACATPPLRTRYMIVCIGDGPRWKRAARGAENTRAVDSGRRVSLLNIAREWSTAGPRVYRDARSLWRDTIRSIRLPRASITDTVAPFVGGTLDDSVCVYGRRAGVDEETQNELAVRTLGTHRIQHMPRCKRHSTYSRTGKKRKTTTIDSGQR